MLRGGHPKGVWKTFRFSPLDGKARILCAQYSVASHKRGLTTLRSREALPQSSRDASERSELVCFEARPVVEADAF